jgi:hypothetical protein
VALLYAWSSRLIAGRCSSMSTHTRTGFRYYCKTWRGMRPYTSRHRRHML